MLLSRAAAISAALLLESCSVGHSLFLSGSSVSLSDSDIEKHDCRVPGVISRSPRLVSSFEDVQPFADCGHQRTPRTILASDQPLTRARRASDVQLWGSSHCFMSLKRRSALIIHVANVLIWSGGISPSGGASVV